MMFESGAARKCQTFFRGVGEREGWKRCSRFSTARTGKSGTGCEGASGDTRGRGCSLGSAPALGCRFPRPRGKPVWHENVRIFHAGCAEPEARCEGASGDTRRRVCSPTSGCEFHGHIRRDSGFANSPIQSVFIRVHPWFNYRPLATTPRAAGGGGRVWCLRFVFSNWVCWRRRWVCAGRGRRRFFQL